MEEISWIIFFYFFASFQELCEMRHGLLTGVCLNIRQSNRGLQTAGRLHSRQKLQPGPRPVGESPLLFFSSSTLEQLCKALLCIDSLHLHHGGLSTLALFFHQVHAEMDKCWITKFQVIIFYFLSWMWNYSCHGRWVTWRWRQCLVFSYIQVRVRCCLNDQIQAFITVYRLA